MISRIKGLVLLIGAYLLHSCCYGQDKFVGQVLDEHYKPIPGATIAIKGAKGATVTHPDGKFTYDIPPTKGPVTLVISNPGYDPIEKQVEDFDSVYTFRLLPALTGPPPPPENVVKFPWPPPQFSGESVIDRARFAQAKQFGDVDLLLSKALQSLQYGDKAYYYIPGGFALVSRIEQIDKNGDALPPPGRWSVETVYTKQLSWREYIRRLFFTTPGYFRIIVFTVTDQPFASNGRDISRDSAMVWLSRGLNVLPASIANKAYSPETACTALIYEFQKPESGEPILDVPGILTGLEHLNHSKIPDALQKR
jgi:CarboxypepD_reg-like domain